MGKYSGFVKYSELVNNIAHLEDDIESGSLHGSELEEAKEGLEEMKEMYNRGIYY